MHDFSISLDGYAAGPAQSVADPWGGGRHRHGTPRVRARPRPDASWRGWWGEDPPFHHEVFVLTHHPRERAQMAGGITFHCVIDGIEAALERARAVDELHLVVVPVLLGAGGPLRAPRDGPRGLDLCGVRRTASVTHVRLRRRAAGFDTMEA